MNKFIGSLILILALVPLTVQGQGGDKKGEIKPAQEGTWVVVSMEQEGMKLPAEAVEKMGMKLTLQGDNYTVTMGEAVIDKGTSKVDMTKKPITVDVKSEDGPNKGKMMLAIVEFDGESMKVCYATDGKARPNDFSAKEGSGRILITYKKEAAKK